MKRLRTDDLVNNPTPRVPICLCLDTSYSMSCIESNAGEETGETCFRDGKEWRIVTSGTTRLDLLQDGIKSLFRDLLNDEIAMFSAEISIVTFHDNALCLRDFDTLEQEATVPTLSTGGEGTNLGAGINLALDMLEQRKKEYQDKGVDYYQPWLVLMTDGEPNGDKETLHRAITRTAELVNKRKLTLFPIGIGEEADMKTLASIAPNEKAYRLKGMRFSEFFQWLSRSVARTSQSMPGETIAIDLEGIQGWGEL